MARHVIWKFPLVITDRQNVFLQIGAKLLTVQLQFGEPVLWAEVNPQNASEPREIAIYGTGNMLPERPGVYLATFQQGPFVWHVYDRTGLE